MQRLKYIDRLKGLAILLVVTGHISIYNIPEESRVSDFVGTFHMPLFMFLSGYVIKELPGFHKLLSKLPLFWCPMFIIGIVHTYLINRNIGGFLGEDFKLGYWYIYLLGIFYIILFLRKIIEDRKQTLRFSVATDLLFLYVPLLLAGYIYIVFPALIWSVLGIPMIFRYWLFFYLGYLIRKYALFDRFGQRDWFYTMCMLLSPVCIYIILTVDMLFISDLKVLSLFIIFFLLSLFERRECNFSFWENQLAFLGKHSLDIYVLHFFLVYIKGALRLDEFGRWLVETNNVILDFFICVVVAIPICYLSILLGKVLRESRFVRLVVFGEFGRHKS